MAGKRFEFMDRANEELEVMVLFEEDDSDKGYHVVAARTSGDAAAMDDILSIAFEHGAADLMGAMSSAGTRLMYSYFREAPFRGGREGR